MLAAPRRLAAVIALSLAFPAAALAQGGAGDQQYLDPFGASGGSGSSGGGSKTKTPPRLRSTPPAAAPTSSTPQPSTTVPPATSQEAGGGGGLELAATGADPAILAALGAGLVLTGAGLRLRLRVD
ncbi:MAG TPA: hypothetical protein VE997_00880 [Candidatus Limnocylindria bacterium]|nr:hypothetical protein [Candidatus Limnocylindria bacterium]